MNRLLIYFFKFKHKTYLSPEKTILRAFRIQIVNPNKLSYPSIVFLEITQVSRNNRNSGYSSTGSNDPHLSPRSTHPTRFSSYWHTNGSSCLLSPYWIVINLGIIASCSSVYVLPFAPFNTIPNKRSRLKERYKNSTPPCQPFPYKN